MLPWALGTFSTLTDDTWLSHLTLGCGAPVVRCPAASSPASRCSFSGRHESSQRSRCGAESRYRPEERKQKTESAFNEDINYLLLRLFRLQRLFSPLVLVPHWRAFTLNSFLMSNNHNIHIYLSALCARSCWPLNKELVIIELVWGTTEKCLNWPRSTQQSRRPRSLPAVLPARWLPPCCVVCRPHPLLRPSAAPPPYSG